MEGRTPGYLVREKLQRDKLVESAEKRAWGFEERLEEAKGSNLARKCLRKIKERWSKSRWAKGWEEERKEFFGISGMEIEKVERKRQSSNN